MPTRKRIYTEQMPPTPCTPDMRRNLYDIALERGVSLASIQREAYSLFLSEIGSKAYTDDSENFKKREEVA